MLERVTASARSKNLAALAGVGLLLALFATYSNHFHNSFHFDDAHTIVNNAAIQSWRNIPRFFVDAGSFSSLPSNQSYRPLVSTLFAIDYKLGGLNPFWFHFSIFAVLLFLLILLFLFLDHLLDQAGPSAANGWIALGAATLFGLHPANADTVNYIVASAEIISTLGIIGSFVAYIAFPELRRFYIYALPAAIAILAKPPAAICPMLLGVYLAVFSDSSAKRRLLEVTVPLLFCAAALLVVEAMTPQSWVAGARNAHNYLITQPYVALLYFKTFLWPNDLSADYDLNPFTTTDDGRFWFGLVFLVLFVTLAIYCARSKRTRVIGFGLFWFLITLLPTSLFPLAEVLNDHRTFLPYIGLVIAVAGLIAMLFQTQIATTPVARIAFPVAVLLILSVSAYATFQRNKVWRTEETLWRDVTIKSPNNPRGWMNYANTLMAKGDFKGALDYFHRALALAPNYPVLFVNLGIAEDATGQTDLAEQHFKEAMRLAPSSPDSYTYYARYLLSHSRAAEAKQFLTSALTLSPSDIVAHDLFKESNSAEKTPESCLTSSLYYYLQARYGDSITAANEALQMRPDYAEAWNNICAANNKLGRFDEALKACEQALRLKPDFDLARNNLRCAQEHCR